jgi:hypothetical protein
MSDFGFISFAAFKTALQNFKMSHHQIELSIFIIGASLVADLGEGVVTKISVRSVACTIKVNLRS